MSYLSDISARVLTWARSGGPQRVLQSDTLVYAVVGVLGVGLFITTNMAAEAFHRQQHALGEEWFHEGQQYLAGGEPQRAIEAFRNALAYSRDNPTYRLQLALALRQAGLDDQARAYLLNLWEVEPGNGVINLELARVNRARGNAREAIRYYRNAIHGLWPETPEKNRRQARLELIEFLLEADRKVQARSELIALAEDLPQDSALLLRVGGLSLQAGDPESALKYFQQVLRMEPQSAPALAGAGEAAFRLGSYLTARGYLQRAVKLGADGEAAHLLEVTGLIRAADPLRRGLSTRQRSQRVQDAFQAALARLESCQANLAAQSKAEGVPSSLQALYSRALAVRSNVSQARLRQDQKLRESVIDLVFEIEEATAVICGEPTGVDLALLLIGRHAQEME